MLKLKRTAIALGLVTVSAFVVQAADSVTKPRPIPITRPEMKQLLEDMKVRKPRIPLPELTEEEKAQAAEQGGRVGGGYEGRLRSLYMPAGEGRGGFGGFGGGGAGGTARPGGTGTGAAPGANARPGGGFGRNSDENMSLDYAFKTQLFWIVSRTNNCQYCMGHQESKLLGAGMSEDEIAALDSDWSQFSPKQQAAYAFARKFTYEPHLLNDADITGLKKHYTDLQILEMIMSMAGNNAINRWKEGVGVPQSQNGGGFGRRNPATGAVTEETAKAEPKAEEHGYLTPTSEKYQKVISKVAVVQFDEKTGQPTHDTISNRPPLEPREAVEKGLAAAKTRKPRLPLVDEEAARKVVPEDWPAGKLPQWVRLVANFPNDGKRTMTSKRSADEKGDLTPLLKAQVSWIIARQDRAWYATGEARQRLKKLGQTDDQIYKLDGSWEAYSPAERSLFTVAKKLAASPVALTDADVEEALKQTGPREVVQLVNYVTSRASFDRITESAGLALDE